MVTTTDNYKQHYAQKLETHTAIKLEIFLHQTFSNPKRSN